MNIVLFEVGGTHVTPAGLLMFTLAVVGTLWANRLVQLGLRRAAALRGIGDEHSLALVQSALRYVLTVLGVGIALETLGVDMKGVLAASAVLAVGIGLTIQNLVRNFASGIVLLMEQSVRPGDVIESEGELMRVTSLGLRAVTARTLDDEAVLIPNSVLAETTVRSYGLGSGPARVRVVVGVHYDTDLGLAMDILQAAGDRCQWRSTTRASDVLLLRFANSAIELELSVWTDEAWELPRRRSALALEMWSSLRAAHIRIAYPQLELHLPPPAQVSPLPPAVTPALAGRDPRR